jgi:hypothetical protein
LLRRSLSIELVLMIDTTRKGFEMIKTLLLICTVGTPNADCSIATAEVVIQGPDAASLVECGLHGQAYIADGAIAGYLDGAHYLKIACTSGQRLPAPEIEPIQTATEPPDSGLAID